MKSPSTESNTTVKDAMELNNTRSEKSPSSEKLSVTISVKAEKEGGQFNEGKKYVDHPQLGQWLRAAVLGANDGLVSTASLMIGVGAVKTDEKTMIMSGLAALIAGACSMAIGEFISVQTQRDLEISSLKRNKVNKGGTPSRRFEPSTFGGSAEAEKKTGSTTPQSICNQARKALPNPLQAAAASACAFSLGALVPLVSAAFIENYAVRIGVVAGVSSLALVIFGVMGAYFGRASLLKGGFRVLVGGWIAMSMTFGLLKLFHRTGTGDDL